MVISILPSDHPYGLFNFQNEIVSGNEQNKIVSLKVIRSLGKFGTVRIDYQIVLPLVGRGKASSMDISEGDGFVEFSDGEVETTVNITIVDDITPEEDEAFAVNLTTAKILQPISGILFCYFICYLKQNNNSK